MRRELKFSRKLRILLTFNCYFRWFLFDKKRCVQLERITEFMGDIVDIYF